MPLAVLGNVVRLCFTIAVAEVFGQNAGKAVETNFGFITFAVALGCVFLVARWLEKSELKTPPQLTRRRPYEPSKIILAALVLALDGRDGRRAGAHESAPAAGRAGRENRPMADSKNLEVLLPETSARLQIRNSDQGGNRY